MGEQHTGGRGVLSTPLKILIFSRCWPLKPRFRLRPFETTVGLRLKPWICRNPACACRAAVTCRASQRAQIVPPLPPNLQITFASPKSAVAGSPVRRKRETGQRAWRRRRRKICATSTKVFKSRGFAYWFQRSRLRRLGISFRRHSRGWRRCRGFECEHRRDEAEPVSLPVRIASVPPKPSYGFQTERGCAVRAPS